LKKNGASAEVERDAANRLNDQKAQLLRTENILNLRLTEMEKQRVTFIQEKYERFLAAHLKFHIKCVENYSAAISKISIIRYVHIR
jgi:hypothetical protein